MTGLGARIAAARRDAGLTQRGLADLAGVRLWMIDQWESEERIPPDDKLDAVAKATGKSRRWLETGLEEPSNKAPMRSPEAPPRREARAPAPTDNDALLRESRRALEQARAEAAALRAELARVRAEHEAAASDNGGVPDDQADVAAIAKWLTQTVRAAAKQEADGIIAAAREEALRIAREAAKRPDDGPGKT